MCHCTQRGDEKILLPLLDESDKFIAGAALAALCNSFGQRDVLLNRIIGFIRTEVVSSYDDNELEFQAILELADLAKNNKEMAQVLCKLAKERHSIGENVHSSNTVFLWERLADVAGVKMSTDESNELFYNPDSLRSKEIKSRLYDNI